MLGALGLNAEDESVYRALLSLPAGDVVNIASVCRLSQDSVLRSVARLEAFGLVDRAGAGRYAAAPPAVALAALISERREALRAAELVLADLAELHRNAVAGRSINELIEVISGVAAIGQRFLQVQNAAREQIRCFVTVPSVAVAPGENPAEEAGTKRGVRIRVIIDRNVLAEPRMLEEIQDSLRHGTEVRVAQGVPIKLVLADDDVGLVPLNVPPHREPGAVLLHRSGLFSALAALFETYWKHAFPLVLAETGVDERPPPAPTELDRKILALLLTGATDQAVAAQLDLSLRTLQRRLRHLMDLAGVESRMQLGWHAARNNWA